MSAHVPQVITITSGKGGVGKTNVAVNLATCLANLGQRVVLLDADFGLANVDVLLGMTPKQDLFQLFNNGTALQDILFPTHFGFSILPAGSGLNKVNELGTGEKLELMAALEPLADSIDYLIVDTGAGLGDAVLYFNIAAQERIVILTPEPTSLADSYALIKVLNVVHGLKHFQICLNLCPDQSTARKVFTRLYDACDQFLDAVSLDLCATLPLDANVRKAVMQQTPFVSAFPSSPASLALKTLASKLTKSSRSVNPDGNIKFFWKTMLFH